MIAILDYEVGNVKSILNMFKKIGIDAVITSDINEIKNADKYILPGVGSFDYGIKKLKESSFFETLEQNILKREKPILGICLGMQLLTNSSEEGKERGLGWIDATTQRIQSNNLPIPHMGWNNVNVEKKSPLFKNLKENNRFYFVHSFYVVANNKENILATVNYENNLVCAIEKNNIYGVQFHPEKSHKFGMQLLKNFGEI